MSRAFNLDTTAAREANSGGKRITETGKYAGTIAAAFYEKNDKGTESVQIMFKSDQGQEAGPLAIYTHKSDGDPLPGNKLVHAIMTCCRVKTLSTRALPVQLFDYDQNAVVTKTKECYTELAGKRIGLVLQQEEYTKKTGEIGTRIVIFAPFSAESELMAAEILDQKKQPEQLGSVMAWIAKNPVRKLRNAPASANRAAQDFQAPADYDEFSDVPF